MAGADIDVVAFGLKVGGTGADETTVFTNKRFIKALFFVANADDATCALSTKGPDNKWVTVHALKGGAEELDASLRNLWFGDCRSPFNGLKVNLSHANDRLYIHLV